MEEKIIEIKNVNKGYRLGDDIVPVLKNIDFTVKKRRVCGNPRAVWLWQDNADEYYRLYGRAGFRRILSKRQGNP